MVKYTAKNNYDVNRVAMRNLIFWKVFNFPKDAYFVVKGGFVILIAF